MRPLLQMQLTCKLVMLMLLRLHLRQLLMPLIEFEWRSTSLRIRRQFPPCGLCDDDVTLMLEAVIHSKHLEYCCVDGNSFVHKDQHELAVAELKKKVRPNFDI